MIVVATVALLTGMFETISTWKVSSALASLFSFSSFVFIVIACKNVIVVGHLLELGFIGLLIKLFFLVEVWIDRHIAVFLWLCFVWITSFLERLLFHLVVLVEVLWRFMIIILRNLANEVLLLSHSWMLRLVIWIMLVILLRLSMLLWSLVGNSLWNVLRLLMLLLELRCHLAFTWNSWSHWNDCWNFSFILRWPIFLVILALVIIIISINKNTLWWLSKIMLMAMRIFIISASTRFSWAKLLITGIELFCHRFINSLSNCAIV